MVILTLLIIDLKDHFLRTPVPPSFPFCISLTNRTYDYVRELSMILNSTFFLINPKISVYKRCVPKNDVLRAFRKGVYMWILSGEVMNTSCQNFY